MDRVRPVYTRQKSGDPSTPGAQSSPMMSSMRHARSGSVGVANFKRGPNIAAKAAAQRLAKVMSYQPDDEDDDDLSFDYSLSSGTGSIGLASGRAAARSRSPKPIPTVQEPPPTRTISGGVRAGQPNKPVEQPSAHSAPSSSQSLMEPQPSSGHSKPAFRSSQPVSPIELPSSTYSTVRSSQSVRSSDLPSPPFRSPQSVQQVEQPSSAHSTPANARLSQSNSTFEQLPSSRTMLAGRPQLAVKTVPMVPSSVPITLRPNHPLTPTENQEDSRRSDRRFSMDMGNINFREMGKQTSAGDLQDELDMLQEENESLSEKLRLAEEKFEEAEARARQLEKQVAQVATLGEGATLEARLISRKEAAFHREGQNARDEATSALDHQRMHEIEVELESLRIMTHRMILTHEEMEELVLKRCWLARYWNLCVRHGIHPEIAGARHEYWSSFASSPVEVVMAAGQKAKEEIEERDYAQRELNNLSGDSNIEIMLFVERGLRELAALKVEDAVAVAMAQNRRPNVLKSEDLKLATDGLYEAFELSAEESVDVFFKQAWLAYFWRRAKSNGMEPDIADERWQFWINRNSKTLTSIDAVDAERGMIELKKLGIETQLWQASRKGLDLDSNTKRHTQTDF